MTEFMVKKLRGYIRTWPTTIPGVLLLVNALTSILICLFDPACGLDVIHKEWNKIMQALIGLGLMEARSTFTSTQDLRVWLVGMVSGLLLVSGGGPVLAGDAVAAKPELEMVAGKVTEGRKFDLWAATQVYGMVSFSLDSEEVGGGVRLAYMLNDHVRVRADYYAAELDVDRVAEDTSLSLAFLYPVEAVAPLVIYTITGIGVSDFEDPALELIAGVGVEYEFELWRLFGEYQYSSEDEDSVLRLGIGMNF